MGKELIISLDEAEAKLVSAVNAIMLEYGLPCYLMEPIVEKTYRQVLDGKQAEIAAAKARMEESNGTVGDDQE